MWRSFIHAIIDSYSLTIDLFMLFIFFAGHLRRRYRADYREAIIINENVIRQLGRQAVRIIALAFGIFFVASGKSKGQEKGNSREVTVSLCTTFLIAAASCGTCIRNQRLCSLG